MQIPYHCVHVGMLSVTFVYVRMLCGVRMVSLSCLRCNLKHRYLFSPIYLALGYLERAWMLQFPIIRYKYAFLALSDTFWSTGAGRERKGVSNRVYVYVNRNMHLRTQNSCSGNERCKARHTYILLISFKQHTISISEMTLLHYWLQINKNHT